MKNSLKILKKIFLLIICAIIINSNIFITFSNTGSGGGGGGDSNYGSASGGGGGSDSNYASASGGGNDSDTDSIYYDPNAWESINDYYDYLDNIGITIPNDINVVSGIPIESRANSGPGPNIRNPINKDDSNSINLPNLANYTPITAATVYQNGDYNINGIMVTNGLDTKFVVTSKDGKTVSEYLTDWAILTTSAGDKGWYRFDSNGSMTTGLYNGKDGNTYYFLETGPYRGMLATGFVNINGVIHNFSHGNDGLPYGALITQ